MLAVVAWKWGPFYRATHVNNLAAMIRRNTAIEHRFFCVTDDWRGIDRKAIEVVPMPTVMSNYPRQTRRLMMFNPLFASIFGRRFLLVDLDMVIVSNIDALLAREEEFIAWRCPCKPKGYCYNPSFMMMDVGYHPEVWNDFKKAPERVLKSAEDRWGRNADQSVLSEALWRDVTAWWGKEDGIYSLRDELDFGHMPLPDNARVIGLYGDLDPSRVDLQQRCPWIKQHWHA